MGLFSWLGRGTKRPTVNPGPDASGVYSRLPKGAKWGPGPDPAGDPLKFVPGRGDLYFDLVEWGWQDHLKSAALIRSPDGLMGFGFLFALSDGSVMDGAESYSVTARGGELRDNCAFVILQGRVVPDTGLFTARCKFFLAPDGQEGDGRYAEFFLNINSVTKKLWISEKASAYRTPILNWVTGQAGGMPTN